MLDVFHIPDSANSQIFLGNESSQSNNWRVWSRPRNISMMMMLAQGGGGGGGGGASGASGNRGGGGGGGGGSFSKLLIPALVLPDRLYIYTGTGGTGGAAGNAGTSGKWCQVGTTPDAVSNSTLILHANGGNAGQPGTTSGSASGANAVGADNVSTQACGVFGISQFLSGVSGNSGGPATGGVGSDISLSFSSNAPVGGGAGGGGCNASDFAGGGMTSSIFPVTYFPYFKGLQIPGGAAGGGRGGDGLLWRNQFFWSLPGSGGGSAFNGTGGQGGMGGPGSGGGGGGGGITGGRGGDGGPAMVMFIWW